MRIRGLGRLGQLRLSLGKKLLSGSCVIVLYHRVSALVSDPQMLSVTSEHFAQHLEVMQDHGVVIPLLELSERLAANDLPKRAVVVTFDDGYADNLLTAKPILQRYEAPATVFVATDGAEQKEELYWDELERLLLQPGELPRELSIDIDGQKIAYEFGDCAYYKEDEFLSNSKWNVRMDYAPTSRHFAYSDLCGRLTRLTPDNRSRVVAGLREQIGAPQIIRDTHRAMNATELRELVSDGLIDVGAHTRRHSYLASLDENEQRIDMAGSKLALERIVGREVSTFSYPYGTKSSYTHSTVQCAKEIGFRLACSNFAEPLTPWTDRFQLPRYIAGNWDGAEFGRFLDKCYG